MPPAGAGISVVGAGERGQNGEATGMAGERDLSLIADRTLAERAQRGGRSAFDELYRRHAAASWRLAQAVTHGPGEAEAAVAGAFAATLGGRSAPGAAPDRNLRLSLLTATRHAATDPTGLPAIRSEAGRFDFGTSEPAALAARDAFEELPERWRSGLWLVDVDGCPLDDAATVLELSSGAATALVDRARLGLQEQVLQVSLGEDGPAECHRATDCLTAYTAGALAASDAGRVRRHLDRCEPCRARLAALDDLVPALRATAPALPASLATDSAARWSAALIHDAGPLHLLLPGGRPVPPWAQRAAAGAVAAAVALGIAGATVLSGGRNRSGSDQTRPATAEAPLGESALGDTGLSDLVLDGGGFVPPSAGASDAAPGTDGSTGATTGAPLPRTTAPDPAPSIGDALVVPRGPGGSSSSPPTTTPPTPPPPTPNPPSSSPQLTVDVGGVATVTIGETCTGAQVAGTVIGCDPPATEGPISLATADSGSSTLPTAPLGL